jgi:hypothetical protein
VTTHRKKHVLDRQYLDLIKGDDDREAIETLIHMGVEIATGKRLPIPTAQQEFRTDPLENAANSTEKLRLRTDDHALFVKTGRTVDSLRFRNAEGHQETLKKVKQHLGLSAGQMAITDDVEYLIPSVKGIPIRVHGLDWQSLGGHTRIPPTEIQVMDIGSPRWLETPSQTQALIPNYRLHFELQCWIHDLAVESAVRPSADRRPLPGDAWDQSSRSMVYDLRDYLISAMSIIDQVDPEKFLKVASFSGGLHLPDMARAQNEYQNCLISLIENNVHFSKISFSQISKLISEEIERGTEWKFHTSISKSEFIPLFSY